MQKRLISLIVVIALGMTLMSSEVQSSTVHGPAAGLSGFVKLLSLDEAKAVHAVAWSPDASKVVVGDDSGAISIYDSSSGVLIKRIAAHTNAISAISWSKQGKVATGSYDNTVKIWDASSWKQIGDPIKNHTDRVWDVAWSNDGSVLATAGRDGKVFTFNPDGKYLAEMEVSVTGLARALSWEPAGDYLVGIIEDDFTKKPIIYKWSAASGKSKKELTLNSTAFDVSWDSKGNHVGVALQNGSVILVDPDLFLPQKFIPVSGGALYAMIWGSGDSKDQMVVAGDNRSIYTVTTAGGITSIPNAHSDIITCLSLSPNGTMYASGSKDMSARVWGDPHPQVVWHAPANDAKNVSVKTNITLKFDRAMNETSLRGSIGLFTAQFNLIVKENNTIAVLQPQGDLAYEATYTVTVKSTAKDVAGGNMSSDFSFMFKTEIKPSSPVFDVPWLWVGVGLGVIFLIIIIAIIVSRKRAGKRVLPQRKGSEVNR
jgi:WD40 repeat protein